MDGWIKIHRQITDSDMYFDERFDRVHAWLDLLLMAAISPRRILKRGVEIKIEPGDVAISERALAERWGWCTVTVRKYLKWLEVTHRIKIVRSHTINVIRVVNWKKFQNNEPQNEPQNEPHYKKVKEEYKENNTTYCKRKSEASKNGESRSNSQAAAKERRDAEFFEHIRRKLPGGESVP